MEEWHLNGQAQLWASQCGEINLGYLAYLLRRLLLADSYARISAAAAVAGQVSLNI